MNKLPQPINRFIQDQRAAEVSEVGLYLSIVVAGCILLMAVIGPAVVQMWQIVANALGV